MPDFRTRRGLSKINHMKYDSLQHTLEIRICNQIFTYIGIPESLYLRLSLEVVPDNVFMNDVFNKYPVVVTIDPNLPPPRRPKKKSVKKARQSSAEST